MSACSFACLILMLFFITHIANVASSPPSPAEVAKKFKASDKLQQCSFRFSIDVPQKGKFEAAVRGSSIVTLKDQKAVDAAAKEAATKKQEPKEVKESRIQLSIIAKHDGFPYNSPVGEPVELEYVEKSKSYKITKATLGIMLFNYEGAHYYENNDAPTLIDLSKSEQLLGALEGILAADEATPKCGEGGSIEAYAPQDFPSHIYGLSKKIARSRALDSDNKFNCDSFTIDVQDDSAKTKDAAQVQIDLRTIKVEENRRANG